MRWLVTGGVGFIGTNLVDHLMQQGHDVVVLDDMSRGGVEANAAFQADRHGVEPALIDVADGAALEGFLTGQDPFDAIAHLAGQVSLMASIDDPIRDFQVNALGTLNVLEHVRLHSPGTVVMGMSSNKLYGDLSAVRIVEEPTRYVAPDWPRGFDESLPMDFHGPYGCSKGVADQYLGDYARTYGLRTASLRQSSVYGPHQHPRSDQGWVAHLLAEAVAGNPIQLNGVGKQVRDLLHATDLARLFERLAEAAQPGAPLQVNVGGGPDRSLSILELFAWLEDRLGRPVEYATGPERPSDQKVFVSDNVSVSRATGWEPRVTVDEGLTALLDAAGEGTAGR
ncbi:MAG: NAD-dependent epimerase/dehydratase family protein [Thermoleophilia bacterium]